MAKKRVSKNKTNTQKTKRALKQIEKDFIERYQISADEYIKTKINIDELSKIEKKYSQEKNVLIPIANSFLEALRDVEGVHSLRMRIKEPEHLVKKLIRKQLEKKTLEITSANYEEYIGDKIGIRILNLYKTDWFKIHDFIIKTWELYERPFAYIREGDSKELYERKKCNIEIHKMGYRSVHYLIKTKPMKVEIPVEIQVRTLFEEGWSEIDHRIRYPYNLGNRLLNEYLAIFNRLAGSADEMGSFILQLKNFFENQDKGKAEIQVELQRKNDELNKAIGKLKISEKEKKNLEEKVKNLSISNDELNTSLHFNQPLIQGAASGLIPLDTVYDSPNIFTPVMCKNCGKEIQYSDSVFFEGLCNECRATQSPFKIW